MPQLMARVTPDDEVRGRVPAAVGEELEVMDIECIRVRAARCLAAVVGARQDETAHRFGDVAGVGSEESLVADRSGNVRRRRVRHGFTPLVGRYDMKAADHLRTRDPPK